MVLKTSLSFCARRYKYLLRILSVHYRRKPALSVALVIAGTYVESLPRTHVFFLIFSGAMI